MCQSQEMNAVLADRLLDLLPEQLERFNDDISMIIWLFNNVIERFDTERLLNRLLNYFNSPVCETDSEGMGLVALCLGMIHSTLNLHYEPEIACPAYYTQLLERLYYFKDTGAFDTADEDLRAAFYTLIAGIFTAHPWLSESLNLVQNRGILEAAADDMDNPKLKREVYLCIMQVTTGKTEVVAVLFEHELMEIIVQDFVDSPDEGIRQDACWILVSGAESCPVSGTKLFMKYKQLWVPFVHRMGSGNEDTFIAALLAMLNQAETLQDDYVLFNPIALLFAEAGGLEVLDQIIQAFPFAGGIKNYFGENYDNYLARRRGLTTKKATS